MSQYSTGELAKLCGVSVRTVQYYDSRNILVPSAFSEGGRRLYSQDDLEKMQIICFLREMGFSIDHIGTLFSDESSEKLISLLIEQQEQQLFSQLQEQQQRLDKLSAVKRALKHFERISVQSFGDIARMMKNQKKRRRMLTAMVILGLLMDAIELGTLIYGIKTGVWWPLFLGLPVAVGLGVCISRFYFHHADYICPQCHQLFHPRLREALWASHTPNTRRLTCPGCGHRGFCVEIYAEAHKKGL